MENPSPIQSLGAISRIETYMYIGVTSVCSLEMGRFLLAACGVVSCSSRFLLAATISSKSHGLSLANNSGLCMLLIFLLVILLSVSNWSGRYTTRRRWVCVAIDYSCITLMSGFWILLRILFGLKESNPVLDLLERIFLVGGHF